MTRSCESTVEISNPVFFLSASFFLFKIERYVGDAFAEVVATSTGGKLRQGVSRPCPPGMDANSQHDHSITGKVKRSRLGPRPRHHLYLVSLALSPNLSRGKFFSEISGI
jgi:hypothetical protein